MCRFVFAAVLTAAAVAQAQPVTSPTEPARPGKPAPPGAARLPAVGDALGLQGMPGAPKLDWLYDVPALGDAAGKVVIHWFCAPRIATCTDDLARIVTLRDTGKVYIVAYINGSKADARKLDPIRESEGVGRGTVAFGRGATRLMKDLGITGPASIVVDVDGKVQLVTASAAPGDLDARDAKVTAAAAAIKEYLPIHDGPATVKAGDKFQLSITIRLASWLKYSTRTPMEFDLTAPSDLKCDATRLRGEQIKVAGQQLTATVTCSGPRGSYGARGELRFGYDAPGGGAGLGAESAEWKFEIKP
ncbi:MAG TPA: hypothetical protein VHW23_30755 [Kofleriaceae bacterium]|jgi:hypothetical protein|nr:hypothetical protein [Kofleriaceae bacterium]